MPTFDTFNLTPSIMNAIKEMGYKTPTPIQEKAIGHILKDRDLLAVAQTGTGKTAAYGLPTIHKLLNKNKKLKPKSTRVLILVPTRELATQVEENITSFGEATNLKTKVIFGGVSILPQIKALSDGLDFIIATPGRLLDLINNHHADLSSVETFILDEADRMLDMGMINDIKKIIKELPKSKQTLLFSATMPEEIEKLANSLLINPVKITVTPESSTVEKINQSICFISKSDKNFLLAKILTETDVKSALIFSKTKHGADRIVKKLAQSGIDSLALHGNKSQNNREITIEKFKNKEIKYLIATDIAARGIDIDHITHVINFNLPEDPTQYVHRIGRTARAGREGAAISFCDGSEIKLLKSIEKYIKIKIPVNIKQPFHQEIKELEILAGRISKTKNTQKLNMSKKARRRRSFSG